MSEEIKAVTISGELYAFLMGEADLGGIWFGESEGKTGAFWWRSLLANAAANTRAHDGDGWRDIESAPKDGTRILIAGGTRQHPDSMGGPEPITQPYIAHWNTLWKQWEGNPTSHDDCYSHEPTHWRPLPEPPALKASGEE